MRTVAAAVVAVPALLAGQTCFAADADRDRLVGSWRLVAFEVAYQGEAPRRGWGEHPKGRLILGGNGRMAAILTAEERKPGVSDAERAALHRTMSAYTGTYRDRGQPVHHHGRCFLEPGVGRDRAGADYRSEGDRLIIELRGIDPNNRVGAPYVRRLIWEPEK